MNHSISTILLQANEVGGALFIVVLSILLGLALFFILRSILLWYWKVNEIVRNQERQIILIEQQNRRDNRVNFYKALALGDNEKAYECALYLIFHDLTDPLLTNDDEKKAAHENLKQRYFKTFESMGYEFPKYPFN